MKKLCSAFYFATLLFIFITSCQPQASPLDFSIYIPSKCKLSPSQVITVTLTSSNIPSDAKIEWLTDKGKIVSKGTTMAEFTAPDMPGPVVITVMVTVEGKTATKNETCTVELPATDTPQLSYATITPKTILESPTVASPTLQVPTPAYDFKSGCISELWQEWPSYMASKESSHEGNCQDFSNWGMLATKEGLKIFVKQPSEEVSFGITTDIPKTSAEIIIRMQINNLETRGSEADTNFYIGLVDSTQKELTGKFLIFRAYKIDYLPALIYGDYPAPPQARQILIDAMSLGKEITVVVRKDQLSFDLIVSRPGSKAIEITDVPYNSKWDKLLIGYQIPTGSTFSAIINDLQSVQENNP